MTKKLRFLFLLVSQVLIAQIPTADLVAQYNFDNGTLLEDAIAGADFIQTGTNLTELADRFEISATDAVTLNGDYLTRPDIEYSNNSLDHGNNQTISFWIKTTTNVSQRKTIIDDTSGRTSQADNDFAGYYIYLQNGRVGVSTRVEYAAPVGYRGTGMLASTMVDDGNWHHVAVLLLNDRVVATQKSRVIARMYIDGVDMGSASDEYTLPNGVTSIPVQSIDTNGNIVVGNNRNASLSSFYQYEDSIDDILFYNRNLSASDVLDLKNDRPIGITRLYVDALATGNNIGVSWTNAYTALQDALASARDGDEIWIAKGTYTPATSSRTASFTLLNNDLKIYGGFDGTETTLADRNTALIHTANATILSGDLQGNDNATVNLNDASRADNSYRVVWVVRENIEIDGVTISDGHANASSGSNRFGAGLWSRDDVANFSIRNSILKNNSALLGSALYLTADNSTYNINACVFENNMSSNVAAAIYAVPAASSTMDLTITNSLFNNNRTEDANGGSANGLSAVWARAFHGGSSIAATIVNNTFVNNSNGGTGNSDFATFGLSQQSGSFSSLTVANNIFWGNTDHNGNTALAFGKRTDANLASGLTIVNSIDEDGFSNIASANLTSTSTANPLFTNASSNDFTLQSGSPAVDSGNNSSLPAGITTDLSGNIRIFNTTVDMGAYEYNSTLGLGNVEAISSLKLYPNPTSSILNIKTNVAIENIAVYNLQGQKVLESTKDTIDVSTMAKGMYVIKVQTASGRFLIKRFIKE